MKTVEMTGKRFGRLVVIERNGSIGLCAAWLCRCDCGNTLTVSGALLRRESVKSCGCLKREILEASAERQREVARELTGVTDLVGSRFGSLTIISRTEWKGVNKWECRCDCGNTVYRHTAEITVDGRHNSCGCKKFLTRRPNWIGKRFGRLIIIGLDEEQTQARQKTCFICQCDCGNTAIVSRDFLRSGHTQSCGCLRLESESKNGSTTGIENSRLASKYTWHVNVDGKRINLRSGLEQIYAEYLIRNNVRFAYELVRFQLAPSMTYTPDFYLYESDEWVEVKGYASPVWETKRRLFTRLGNKLNVIRQADISAYLDGETYSAWFRRNKSKYHR